MNLIRAASLVFVLFASSVNANYIYEANQSLINLTNETGTTNMAVGDDQVSSAFNLDFTFTFYGEDFTSARMATNGCLHFKATGGYCNDYTPDPLPEITYTLYPFWTDLIRDNGSKVLAKNFTDKSVFGWYNLREYNRSNTDNSFEVILWKSDDSFEFRYGGLNIINHDVLIGEQGASDELYTYLFHDQCGKGTTNVSGTCVNNNWNNSSFNTLLENGGSLHGVGSGNALDCNNPLNNTACAGYDAAYLTQQCDLDGLYSTQCPNYWDDLFDYECSLDAQHSPACAGYMVETFFDDTYYQDDMFGYEEYEDSQYGYYDPNEEEIYFLEEEHLYISELQGIEIYEEELYFEETLFFEEEYFVPFIEEFDSIPEEELITLSYIEEEIYINHIYEEIIPIEETFVVNYDLPRINDLLLNHFEYEEHIEEYIDEESIEYLEFETIEELEEWFEEEAEEIFEELAVLSDDEDGDLENTETGDEKIQDREETVELVVAENEEKKDNKRAEQLNVVANTIRAASNSVSGTTSGTSTQATGNSIASGGTSVVSQNSAIGSSVSGGTVSIDSSPSISAQVASSAQQTQQILSMSVSDIGSSDSVGTTNTNISITEQGSESTDNTGDSSATGNQSALTETVVVESQQNGNQMQDVQSVIDTAISGSISESEADQVANQIVAQNIENQKEEMEQQQQETGEYADSSQLVAYMGYVPGFNSYRQVQIPNASIWYESEEIYANVSMSDNNQAFLSMFGNNLTRINDMVQSQPNL